MRLKTQPKSLSSKERQLHSWELTEYDQVPAETQLLDLLGKSRVACVELASPTKVKTTCKSKKGKYCKSSYLECLSTLGGVGLSDAACVVRIIVSPVDFVDKRDIKIRKGTPRNMKRDIKIRSRSFKAKSSEGSNFNFEDINFILTKCGDGSNQIVLLFDVMEDNYLLQTMKKNQSNSAAEGCSTLISFSLNSSIYPDMELLNAVANLSKSGKVFITCYFLPNSSGIHDGTVDLVLEEWINVSMALDYGLPDSQKGFICSEVTGNKNRFLCMFLNHVFDLSADNLECLQISSEKDFVSPDDIAEILALSQNERPRSWDTDEVQSKFLLPKMRPYQLQAVKWMLQKEKQPEHCFINSQDSHIHPFFCKVSICNQTKDITVENPPHMFVNVLTGEFSLKSPLRFSPVPGGILADEMGLGKTIEVLDVILKNKRSSNDYSAMNSSEVPGDDSQWTDKEWKIKLLPLIDGKQDMSCVCGAVTFDEEDITTNLTMGYPIQCSQCQSWLHPSCVNFTQKDELLSNTGVAHDKKRSKKQNLFVCPKNYLCPFCVVQQKELVEVGCTLIVSPRAICEQWIEEIEKHVKEGTVKVLNYTGVISEQGFIHPSLFEQYDVVVTTFETLKSEIYHTDMHYDNTQSPIKRSNVVKQKLLEADPHPCRLRRAKRYRSLPSPLVCVNWWRICVDEAQMIECQTAKATEMLLKLHSVNKWCVTGTPIQRSIDDLYGIMLFLQIDLLRNRHWWTELVVKNIKQSSVAHRSGSNDEDGVEKTNKRDMSVLLKVLRTIMWRTVKDQVRDQIQIPAQHINTKSIAFSPIETHFYERKKSKCGKRAFEIISKLDQTDSEQMLSKLDWNATQKILLAVSDLRKACIHPQMVKGHTIGNVLKNNKLLTMEELLREMHSKAVKECEESARQICSCLNGMAGLEILKNNIVEAVELYREALRRVSSFRLEGIRTDPLPKIHTYYNLNQLINIDQHFDNNHTPIYIPPTIKDSELYSEYHKLKVEYLTAFDKDVQSSFSKWSKISSQLSETRNQVDFKSWLAYLCESVLDRSLEESFIEKIYSDLQRNQKSVSQDFHNMVGLEYLVYSKMESILSTRDKCSQSVQKLDTIFITEALVSSCYECHMKQNYDQQSSSDATKVLSGRRSAIGFIPLDDSKKNSKQSASVPKCEFCQVHTILVQYEKMIFASNADDQNKDHEDSTEELSEDLELVEDSEPFCWKASRLEIICNSISSFASSSALPETDQSSARLIRKMFILLRDEFKFLRSYWRCLSDRISGHDELRMATERFKLVDPNSEVSSARNLIKPFMLPITLSGLQSDLQMYEMEFTEKRGRKKYLENLDETKVCRGGNGSSEDAMSDEITESCPVCKSPFDKQWSVFTCGHSFCLKCLSMLLDDPDFTTRTSPGHSRSDLCSSTLTTSKSKVKCPMCRQMSPVSAVSYVSTNKHDPKSSVNGNQIGSYDIPEVKIKGDLSAKTHTIVATIKDLLFQDPTSKMLVFSSWVEVLNILSSALQMNSVPHLLLKTGSTFHSMLDKFKQSGISYPVLLLPYKSSSSGLNIIEANHVIIVEPVLNPAVIHQAIGRVDRISQTRETHVHLFLIENSVEDQLCHLIPQFNKTGTSSVSTASSMKLHAKKTVPPLTVNDLRKIFYSE